MTMLVSFLDRKKIMAYEYQIKKFAKLVKQHIEDDVRFPHSNIQSFAIKLTYFSDKPTRIRLLNELLDKALYPLAQYHTKLFGFIEKIQHEINASANEPTLTR